MTGEGYDRLLPHRIIRLKSAEEEAKKKRIRIERLPADAGEMLPKKRRTP